MFKLVESTKFKKDLKKALKRSKEDIEIIFEVLELLELNGVEAIPVSMKPHKLIGKYSKNWECHIKPDLLIIWIQIESPKAITLVRLGSHSDLFS